MLKGFDFSHWNGDKQFFPLSKDCDFLFHKITESTSYVDPKAKVRIKDIKVPFGLYHLIRPDKNTTYSGEAANFTHYIDELRRDGYRFGIALDIEQGYVPYDSPTSKLEWIEGMVKYLFDRYGQKIILYMGDLYPDYWYKRLEKVGAAFWICRWTDNINRIKHKNIMSFWQQGTYYRGHTVDLDYFTGDNKNVMLTLLGCDTAQVAAPEKDPISDDALTVIAGDVIAGHYGNGEERKENIYNAVQNRVNEMLGGKK